MVNVNILTLVYFLILWFKHVIIQIFRISNTNQLQEVLLPPHILPPIHQGARENEKKT